MSQDTTNTEKNAESNTVLSVGNSWIVCRSKSHEGRIYYFNTFTGEAAWNLSDVEIEKAKKTTKQLGNQLPPRTRSPEAKENPLMNFQQASQHESNSMPIQQESNILLPGFVNDSKASVSANNFVTIPNNLISTPINTIDLNSVHPMYNPKIWAVPPSQQIFISSTPIANLVQTPLSVAYNNLQRNLSTHDFTTSVFNSLEVSNQPENNQSRQNNFGADIFSQRQPNFSNKALYKRSYTDINRSEHSSIKQNDYYQRNSIGNFSQDRQHYGRKFRSNFNSNDLREKLSVKRKFTTNANPPYLSNVHNFVSTPFKNFKTTSTLGQNPGDYEANDEEYQEQKYEEPPSRLDLTPLRELASSNANSDAWYIVVDTNIVLNEFKFLITLTDSDPLCHLMIPRAVMSNLESYISNSQDVQARRIVRYLTQQIRAGHVKFGAPSHAEDDTANAVLSTCLKLMQENYHQILLTQDNDLLRYKHSSNIHIFTTNELKTLLKPIRTQFRDIKTSTFIANVKNNPTKKEDSECRISVTVANKNPCLHKTINPVTNKPENDSGTNLNAPPKKTVDAGIQTDFDDFKMADENIHLNVESNEKATTNERVDTKIDTTSNLNCTSASMPHKRREIRLKRTSSQPQALSPHGNKKKTFKWRIKRNASAKKAPSLVNLHEGTNVSQPELNSNLCGENKETYYSPKLDCTTVTDNSTGSSDINISKQMVTTNITIEETSTSGIISNSVSNIDAESISSERVIERKPLIDAQNEKKPITNIMYNVETQSMHEYLEMKCDEWVSRFIQIMEEVLSQVLQQEPPFLHSSLPPPWTFHEATQCISMKFFDHSDIKDAASKLSNILFKVSNDKGKIALSMKPSEYMKMYSYGVYLVDTLKGVVKESEDVHIATESLNKLLSDIRHPNLDCGVQESFNDVSLEEETPEITSLEDFVSPLCNVYSEQTSFQSTTKSGKSEQSKYNLRSQKRVQISDSGRSSNSVKLPKNGDGMSLFFSMLNLKKKDGMHSHGADETTSHDRQTDNHLVDKHCGTLPLLNKINIIRTFENNSLGRNGNEDNISNTLTEQEHNLGKNENVLRDPEINIQKENNPVGNNEPKIIRNFGRCIEFEAKLMKKYREEQKAIIYEESYNGDLDYEEDNNTGDYDSAEEYDDSLHHDDSAICGLKTSEDIDGESNIDKVIKVDNDSESSYVHLKIDIVDDDEALSEPCPKPIESDVNNNVMKFKFIIGKVLEEIKEAFYPVKMLCENYHTECKRPNGIKIKKIQLQIKAKKAQLHIANISDALESMMSRERSNCSEDIKSLLRKAGIEHIDESLKEEYSNTIAKCKSYAAVYLESLQNMISELKC